MRNALKKGARGDKNFIAIQLLSIGIILSYVLNVFFLSFGEKGFLLSKIMLSTFATLFMIQLGVFTKVKIDNFSQKTKYTKLVIFIVSLIVFTACSISYLNISSEIFFTYKITKVLPVPFNLGNITVFVPGQFWMSYAFFWMAIVFIYGLLNITRIVMRSLINSIHELFINIIFIIEFIFFILFINKQEIF
ncbi:MAG: hypothetical protein KBT21_02940, partial [Treponema sp.]|nr:hypothetical protein [Candidatus Treponema merdequi]